MKRATIICGSGERNGVIGRMCSKAGSVLESEGYEVSLFYPAGMDIHHCSGCNRCVSGDCVFPDDMSAIYGSFAESDVLILTTPIRFSGPSSILKVVMDRFQPFWHKKSSHPRYCVAMMCGGSREPRFEYTEKIIKAFCITIGMEFLGSLTIPDTDNDPGDVESRTAVFLEGIIADME